MTSVYGGIAMSDIARDIAKLASGHSIRLISRELGRSRSTVSREVLRNGGAGKYRASLAEKAFSNAVSGPSNLLWKRMVN